MSIKVVHITENPIAGAPINLSLALNKWSNGEIQSSHIAASDRNENRIYKSDMIIGVHEDAIHKAIKEADIIHFHNFYKNQELFRRYPHLWKEVMRKKRVWQAHTQRDITWMSMEDGLNDKGAKHLVIGQYHPRMYPECTVVPNIIDITDFYLMPKPRENKIMRVGFSPSRVRLKGWDNKGYDETMPVLQKLVNEGKITGDVIFNVPHQECLNRRSYCDIAIDEIVTGSYHLCSLEALSQGCLTIAGLDKQQIKTLHDLTGADWLPWHIAIPNTLENLLRQLINEPAYVKEEQHKSRFWMEKFWHPRVTTQKFIDIYRGL